MRVRVGLLLCTLLMALVALAGCGSTSGAPTGGLSIVSGTVVKPCPGGLSGVTDVGQPDLILTETTTSGDAHVGQIVQVRLAANYRWSMAESAPPSLATQVNGDYDAHTGVCFWTFKAVAAESAMLTFNGTILCEPQSACPGLASSETFTVKVS